MHAADEPSPPLRIHAWPLSLRVVGAVLQMLSAANVVYLLARVLFDLATGVQPPPMVLVARWLAQFSLGPLLGLWILRRLAVATLHLEPARLVLALRGARFEIPLSALVDVRPWRLPLPGPGFSLRMKSGHGFRYGLEAADPAPLLAALDQVGVTGAAAEHPSIRYASDRHALRRRRWYHLALKFGVFTLLPTGILFRLDQCITYGGAFGGYYQLGLKAYLTGFARTWVEVTTVLVLYACVWRGLVEPVVIAAAWVVPSWSRGVRQAAEITCRVVYYVGVPAFLAWRLLA